MVLGGPRHEQHREQADPLVSESHHLRGETENRSVGGIDSSGRL